MLKRFRSYAQANPLSWWLVEVVFLLTLYLTIFWVVPGLKKPGLLLMFAVFTFSAPTGNLLARFSEEQRRERPVPPGQERGVGLLSLFASVCSIGALGTVALSKHLGLFLPAEKVIPLLMLFSVSTLLSLALGYAARRTKAGRWGLRLSSAWLLFLICFAGIGLLLRR